MRAASGEHRGILRALFDAANPPRAVAANQPKLPKGRTVVMGAGKGTIPMATAVEANW